VHLATVLSIGALALGIVIPAPAHAQGAAAVFKSRCARCHGQAGKSDTPDGRSLKVAPLVNDARLARMTPAEIATLVKANAKHRGVVKLDDADLDAAAVFVKHLASTR
jgi:mono/diheme cytochrome c family protein